MPIPDRLRPPPPTAEELAHYTELCRRIEDGSADAETGELIDRWSRRAGRRFDVADFLTREITEADQYATWMLMGIPQFVPDLTYAELRDVLESLKSGGLSYNEDNYYLRWVCAQFPGYDLFDLVNLIYYPNDWFGLDGSMPQVELTPDQTLAYALAVSERRVPGTPDNVPLPYPIPPRTGA